MGKIDIHISISCIFNNLIWDYTSSWINFFYPQEHVHDNLKKLLNVLWSAKQNKKH